MPNPEPRILQNARMAVGNYISHSIESFRRAGGAFFDGSVDMAGMETLEALSAQRERLREALPQPLTDVTDFLGEVGEVLSDVPVGGAQTGAISRSALMRYRKRMAEKGTRQTQIVDQSVHEFQAHPSIGTQRTAHFHYRTPQGENVYLKAHKLDPETLEVGWVGRTPNFTYDAMQNKLDLGRRMTREIVSDLVDVYPEVNYIGAQRLEGMRKVAGKAGVGEHGLNLFHAITP